jgi:hypothetical protein
LAYEINVDSDKILISENPKLEEQANIKREPSLHELTLLEKNKVEGTDIMTFKFSK